jgi:L-lactate dehydrogenase complex protein LldG
MSRDGGKQEAFLNHIAEKLGRPRRSGVKPPEWKEKPYLHLYEGKSQEELIQQFIANLALLNTKVDRVTMDEFATVFPKILRTFEVRSAIFWDDERVHKVGIPSLLLAHGVEGRSWSAALGEKELREYAAKADLGIAFADIGLAETGTVMLMNGQGKGRVVSLLPPSFLCVLSESQIVPRLTQAVEQIHAKVPKGLPACINFITGPSRTGDIEMDLALGVHGPGKVHIILLKE